MKNQWQVWAVIAGVVIVIAVIFGFQAGRSSLFTERQARVPKIEYEFVPSEKTAAIQPAPATTALKAAPLAAVPTTSAVKTVEAGKYSIQIASFADKAKADLVQKKAGESGLPTYIAATNLGVKGTWHRVYVGPFATQDEVAAILPKVKASYRDGFIFAVK